MAQTIDSKAESLEVKSTGNPTADELGAALPRDEPCYAFFAWPHSSRRDIGTYLTASAVALTKLDPVFIYSCPAQSPVKFRMIYSSGSLTTHLLAKENFKTSTLVARKVETSDPQDLNEDYLKTVLGLKTEPAANKLDAGEKKPFARPKGPPRRR